YQIEAAIQSAQIARLVRSADTWPAIVALYDHLVALTRSPVAQLNRAAALAETEGADAALAALAPLGTDRRMASYQPYWAARAHLAARAGRRDDAYEAFTLAIGLATDEAVRRYLQTQRDGLRNG